MRTLLVKPFHTRRLSTGNTFAHFADSTHGIDDPYSNGVIIGRGGKVRAVRRPCNIRQALRMPVQISDELPGKRRPYLRDVVSGLSGREKGGRISVPCSQRWKEMGNGTAGGKQDSVWAELDGGYGHGVTGERVLELIARSGTRRCIRWRVGRRRRGLCSDWWWWWMMGLGRRRCRRRRQRVMMTLGDLGIIFGRLRGCVIFCG